MEGQGRRCEVLALLACCAAGCLEPTEVEPVLQSDETSTGEPVDAGSTEAAPDVPTLPMLRCPTPPGHTGSPHTITEAVAHIQALPSPVDVPCVLESLARPLPIVSTSSVFSAQPGIGERSPRVFLMFDELILSVSTEGDGARLLEFAEFTDPLTTIKAELEFPLEAETLVIEDAFTKVEHSGGTACRFCHRNEQPVDPALYPGAFSSDSLAPKQNTLVELEVVRMYADACDRSEDAYRCDMFDALFAGEVVSSSFPEHIPTIFDYED